MITGSDLEGTSGHVMLSYLCSYLIKNRSRYEHLPHYGEILKMLSEAEELAKICARESRISSKQEYNDEFIPRYEKYHNKFCQNVRKLKPGEKTLIDTGWTGHSMKMEIEREAGGSLHLSLINTGSGLSHHFTLIENDLRLVQPFIELSGVEEARLLDPDYTKALFEMMLVTAHPADKDMKTDYEAKDLYGLFNALGGKLISCRGKREEFMPPQFSGICTWCSLLAFLHKNLELKDYYTLETDISLDSICAFYSQNKKLLPESEEKRQLLQFAAMRLAQQTLDAFNNDAISLERLQVLYATLDELLTALETVEGKAQESKSTQEVVSFQNLIPTEIPSFKPWKPPTSLSKETNYTITTRTTKKAEGDPYIPEWFDLPDMISTNINLANTTLWSWIKDGHADKAIYYLEELFHLLPSVKVWDQIADRELVSVIDELATLSELLIDAVNLYPHRIRTYTAYSHYLSAISYQLSQRLPNPPGILNTKSYKNAVAADIQATLLQDQNLYDPLERDLRHRALVIFASQPERKVKDISFTISNTREISYDLMLSNKEFKEPTLRYIYNYLEEHPEIKEKIRGDDIHDYIAQGLCDWHGQLFPKEFCALRRLDYINQLFLNPKQIKIAGGSGDLFKFSRNRIHGRNGGIQIKGIEKYILKNQSNRDLNENKYFTEIISLRKAQNRIGSNVVQDIKGAARVYQSESDIMKKADPEKVRQLKLLIAQGDIDNKDSHLAQQIIKTIAYFTDHIELLEDPETRMICRFLIFECDFLEQILKQNPRFGLTLQSFVEQGFQRFSEENDIAAVAFFIEMGRDFDQLLRLHNYPATFSDWRERINNFLEARDLDVQEKTPLQAQIAGSYSSHPPEKFTSKDALQLIIASYYQKVYPHKNLVNSNHVDDESRQARERWQPEIDKIFKSEEGGFLCQAIISALTPNADIQNWDLSSYPICRSSDGRYILNLKTLDAYVDGQALTGLPTNILNDEDFTRLFGKNYSCTCSNEHCYEFIDERGIETQIIDENIFISIRQNLNGQWFELTSLDADWCKNTAFSSLPMDFLTLCRQGTMWRPVDKRSPIIIRDLEGHLTHKINIKTSTFTMKIKSICKLQDPELQLMGLNNTYNKPLDSVLGTALLWTEGDQLKELEALSLNLTFKMELHSGVWVCGVLMPMNILASLFPPINIIVASIESMVVLFWKIAKASAN